MPSPKRQKTESPVHRRLEEVTPTQSSAVVSLESPTQQYNASTSIPGLILNSHPDQDPHDDHDVLDVLMQHVESGAAAEMQDQEHKDDEDARDSTPYSRSIPLAQEILPMINDQRSIENEPVSSEVADVPYKNEQSDLKPEDATVAHRADEHQMLHKAEEEQLADVTSGQVQSIEQETTEHLHAAATEVNELQAPTTSADSEQQPPVTLDPSAQAREWETDSSPYESSSTDTDSSDSSDDSSDLDGSDEGDEYTLLDPYEQARILMAESGGVGSDDEEDGHSLSRASRPAGGAGFRTMNEKTEDILPRPNVVITEDMHIEELGAIEAIVESTLLIRAKTSGEYQVLESGSVLCLADRSIVGAVAETLGRVEQPMYAVRFASLSELDDSGLNEKGKKIYYVKEHSTFVFTQPLQGVKGSDASNLHDEEVGADEMEFSDDEAEAEHKRQMKLRRKGIDPDSIPSGGRGRGRGRERGGRGRTHSQRGGYSNSHRTSSFETDSNAYANGGNEVTMNYDDVEQGETNYTPLKRPETMAAPSAMSPPMSNDSASSFMQPQNSYQNSSSRGGYDRNQSRGRGRGNFNNHRGRGRGNYNTYSNNNNNVSASPSYDQPHTLNAHNTFQYSNPRANAVGYNNQHSPNSNFQPPPPPSLTPTNQSTFPGNTFSPSPITPLPGSSFNFPTFPNFNMNANMNQWPQAQQSPQQPAYGGYNNAEAIAQVQRQLEELRRYGANGAKQ